MEKQECDLFHDGECKKYFKPEKCVQCDIREFSEEFSVIDMSEVCRKCSLCGNFLFSITEEDIKAMRDGKVLSFVGEYGIFIAMDKGDME